MSYNIAIDGPAGAGKSTIAKLVAKEKNFIYIDTGAMYRAMGLYLLRQGVDIKDEMAVKENCQGAEITIEYENDEQVVYLNNENVNQLIRTEEAGKMASIVGTHRAVREKLVDLQQKMAQKADVVMDGRDIGTCVLPKADVKIYLTADSSVRAQRRYMELLKKGIACDVTVIEADIIERDRQDMNREVTPLRQAEDAVLVDTTYLSIEEATQAILALCQ